MDLEDVVEGDVAEAGVHGCEGVGRLLPLVRALAAQHLRVAHQRRICVIGDLLKVLPCLLHLPNVTAPPRAKSTLITVGKDIPYYYKNIIF